MRPFVALLLLVLSLPGLVLPAGLWWHVCRCTRPMRAPEPAATCCAGHTAPTNTKSCCEPAMDDGDERRGEPEGERARAKCGCEWIAVADHRPETLPTDPPLAFVPLPHRIVVRLDFDPQPPTRLRLVAVDANNRAPPPDHARNLPLRI